LENASDQYDRLTHQIRDKEQELAILQKKKQAAEDQKGLLEQQSALAKQKSNIVEKIEKLRAYSNRINNHQAEIERCISQINTLWKHFSEETWNKSFEKMWLAFLLKGIFIS
jgi:chromosome segregation ATPase